MQIQETESQYCYFVVKDISSSCIYFIFMVLLPILSIKLINNMPFIGKGTRRISELKLPQRIKLLVQQNKKLTSSVKNISVYLIWWSCYCVGMFVLEEGFYLFLRGNHVDFEFYSKIEFLSFMIAIFWLEGALFWACMIWMKQFIDLIKSDSSNSSVLSESQLNDNTNGDHLKSSKFIRKSIKIYLLIRHVPFLTFFLLIVFVYTSSQLNNFSVYFLTFQLTQSFISLATAICCLLIIKKKVKQYSQQRLEKKSGQISKKFFKISIILLFRLLVFAGYVWRFQNQARNRPQSQTFLASKKCGIQDGFVFYPNGLESLSGLTFYILPYLALITNLKIAYHPETRLQNIDNNQIQFS